MEGNWVLGFGFGRGAVVHSGQTPTPLSFLVLVPLKGISLLDFYGTFLDVLILHSLCTLQRETIVVLEAVRGQLHKIFGFDMCAACHGLSIQACRKLQSQLQ
jgi:hypothetical protein